MNQDYKQMLVAYRKTGGNPEIFKNSKVAHLVIHKNKVYGKHLVDGLILEPEETKNGVNIFMRVKKGAKIEKPVHLCFGVLPEEGIQEIKIRAEIKDGAGIKLLSHCVFPNAVKVVHRMSAEIEIGDDACYEYEEIHFHGEAGGVKVIPEAKIQIGKNSRFVSNFSLLKGRVGVFDMDYEASCGENSTLEMAAKIYGYGNDRIRLKETGHLNGLNSRGLLKSRIAVRDSAESEVVSELSASAAGARGHVDCVEIIRGGGKARAVPIVDVTNEFAKITHEAAIGRVDQKLIETLMARGLDEEKATDIVVGGLLK